MLCPHCEGADDVFGKGLAKRDLKNYHEKGASKSTKILLDMLKKFGVEGKSLLDIGGGIGVIQHELIAEGLDHAIDVDASSAYIQVAKNEAERRGHLDKIRFEQGDFVQLAPKIDSVDVVTLDKVVCCYPDMHALVDLSSARAQEFYGLIYPRDNLISKAVMPIFNFFAFRLWGNPFRTYIHDTAEIDAIIRGNGLQQIEHRKTGVWQVALYQRP